MLAMGQNLDFFLGHKHTYFHLLKDFNPTNHCFGTTLGFPQCNLFPALMDCILHGYIFRDLSVNIEINEREIELGPIESALLCLVLSSSLPK